MTASAAPGAGRRGRFDWLLHETFEVSLLLKGGFAALEAASGVLLALIGPNAILHAITRVTQTGIVADPGDRIAGTLLHWAQGFSIQSQHFVAIYLLVHGLVKLALVAGLLHGRRWAYPTGLVVMSLFVAYQLHRFAATHALGLVLLSVFDLLVIALIWREWRLLATRDHNSLSNSR